MAETKASGWRIFTFSVMVLFGALAAGAVITAVVLLFTGTLVAGLIGLVIAAVLAFMSTSVGRSLREMA